MPQFSSFVIFAEMRTGSNHLEESLRTCPTLALYGEAFNPIFVGSAKRDELLGITLQDREDNPTRLLGAMKKDTTKLPGFRFFHDHDPRILDLVLQDKTCAKIILSRNPLESYVSLKIAQETGQWRMTNPKMAKNAQATFDADEFFNHLEEQRHFKQKILKTLQVSGQTAYYIDYEDITDISILNGIFAFLGQDHKIEKVPDKLKRQNPGALRDKVINPEQMDAAIARLRPFDFGSSPTAQANSGISVLQVAISNEKSLVFQPIFGGPNATVINWLKSLDARAMNEKLTEKELRDWMVKHPGFLSFTVVRHPLVRAYHIFKSKVLNKDAAGFDRIRKALRQQYAIPIHQIHEDDQESYRDAFLGYLRFLKSLLGGQTSLFVKPVLAPQISAIATFSEFLLPHRILREDRLVQAFAQIVGDDDVVKKISLPRFDDLSDIYVTEMDQLVRAAYPDDYVIFGFDRLY